MTSGFLGYTYDHNTCDEHGVISRLKECAHLSIHPMLLPAVILRFWCNYYHDKLDNSRLMLRVLGGNIRRLEKMCSANQDSDIQLENTDQEGMAIKPRYHEIHEILDREYNLLLSEDFDFVKNLSTSCLQALAIIRSFEEQTRKDAKGNNLAENKWIDCEINGHLLHLDGTVNAYEQRRERMQKRMEIMFDQVF
jgi:hypothetical protein